MTALTTRQRNALPASDFVFPDERRYPIHNRQHAELALEFSKGTKDEDAVRAAVAKRYSGLGASN